MRLFGCGTGESEKRRQDVVAISARARQPEVIPELSGDMDVAA